MQCMDSAKLCRYNKARLALPPACSLKGSAMSLSALPSDERAIVGAIIDAALSRGLVVSVYDGEEWPVVCSDSRPAIAENVGITDCTTLRLRDPRSRDHNGNFSHVGRVFLVHGNGCDVIADYSDTSEMERLLAPARALADQFSGVA